MSRREQLEEMLRAEPDDQFLQYALAMECASAGDAPEAVERLDRVIRRDPDYVAAYFQKGQILAREGRTAEAADALRTGIEAARRTGNAHAEGEMAGFLEAIA
ncbi:MAG TPA: tetratricopeptide repeat protein [Planctomycetaceae bacterium]|nr:tetratricopeptide repeat protein [Planctomycetaceae bacterium]